MTLAHPKIEQGIPLPMEARGNKTMKAFIGKLQPGDSFVDFYARRSSFRTYAALHGFKLFVRKLHEGEVPEGASGDARFWRVEKDTERMRAVK